MQANRACRQRATGKVRRKSKTKAGVHLGSALNASREPTRGPTARQQCAGSGVKKSALRRCQERGPERCARIMKEAEQGRVVRAQGVDEA